MKKSKHNKKRNVGIVYELLVSHMTKNLLTENYDMFEKIKQIIENNFNKDTEIYKEYKVFTALTNADIKKTELAAALLSESKKRINKLDLKKLSKEKSNLIKEINYSFGKNFYYYNIPNYKNFATIQNLINEWKKGDTSNLIDMVNNEERVINYLLQEKQEVQLPNLKKDSSSKLMMKLMSDKINEKYDHLTTAQKQIIKNYVIYLDDDKSKLITYLTECKRKVITNLESFKNKNDNEFLKTKINKVVNNIKNLNENVLTDETIVKFLVVENLIKELEAGE